MNKQKIEQGVHYFNVEEAVLYGVEKAILIYNLRFWLKINKANKSNINTKDGKQYYWSFNTVSAYKELFPYLSEGSIQRWLKELEKDGIVIVDSFNKKKYDKTKWYTLPEFEIEDSSTLHQNDETLRQNGESIRQNDDTIPYIKPKIENTDNIYISSEEKETDNSVLSVEISKAITLPEQRGKLPNKRILTIYNDLFFYVFGFKYTPNFGRDLKTINDLLKQYSEVQIARLLTIYFNWHGMNGNNDKDYNYLCSVVFPLTMFKANISKYEAYIRNVLCENFDDDAQMLKETAKYILSIK